MNGAHKFRGSVFEHLCAARIGYDCVSHCRGVGSFIIVSERVYLQRVTEARAGDDPIEASFRANAKLAYAIAARILGSQADAEDLLQDLFLVAQRDLRVIENQAAVRQWFATATVRLARRRLSRRKWLSFFGHDGQVYDTAVARSASPEQHALLRSVFDILAKLPVAQRVAWTLRYVEGMPLQLVAESCECSLATAKRHIAAAQKVVEEAVSDD